MSRQLMILCFLGLFLTLEGSDAFALRPRRSRACAKIFRKVAIYQKLNKRLQCGYKHSLWAVDLNAHKRPCVRSSLGYQRKLELMQRGMQRCYACHSYAASAVQAQRENVSRKCGGRGAAWSTNRAYHFRWCISHAHRRSLKNLRSILQRGHAIRSVVINKCRACHTFTQTLCQLQSKNQKKRCGIKGTFWACNPKAHMSWCLKARRRAREARVRVLNAKLRHCARCKAFARSRARQIRRLKRKRGCHHLKKHPKWQRSYDHYGECMQKSRLWYRSTSRAYSYQLSICHK